MATGIPAENLSGRKYGRLTVNERIPVGISRQVKWNCTCECGKITITRSYDLRSGKTKSCGCLNREKLARSLTKHGLWKNHRKTYAVWQSMLRRCLTPTNECFINYGARGISVCSRWMEFNNFFSDMGDAPEGLSIERMNNDLGYYPENCKWASRKEQNNNKRDNRHLTHNGATKTISEWGRHLGIKPNTISCRLMRGDSIEYALRITQ